MWDDIETVPGVLAANNNVLVEIGLIESGARLPIGWSKGTTETGRVFFTEEVRLIVALSCCRLVI